MKKLKDLVALQQMKICRVNGGLALLAKDALSGYHSPFIIDTGATVLDCMRMPVSFWMLDTNSLTQVMNAEGIQVCGFQSQQEALGHSLIQVSQRESAIQLIENCDAVMQARELKIFEEINIRKDGTQQQFLSVKLPWYDLERGLIGVCGFSIVLGLHALASNLMMLTQLGILNSTDPTKMLSMPISPPAKQLSLPLRERQCLQFIAQGYTAKMMARELSLSYRTIESYIDNLKSRLGVNSKMELIQFAKS